jgi:hypothetical protein
LDRTAPTLIEIAHLRQDGNDVRRSSIQPDMSMQMHVQSKVLDEREAFRIQKFVFAGSLLNIVR